MSSRSCGFALVLAAVLGVGSAVGAAEPSPDAVASASPAAGDGIRVTVRARSDDGCRFGSDCSVGVAISPVGSEVPVLAGTLIPGAGRATPPTALEAVLPPGAYSVTLTALALTEEAIFDDPESPSPVAIGGCATVLALAAGQAAVEVTGVMSWEQPACGIVVEPRIPPVTERPELAAPVRRNGAPPRFRPRGAPDASATASGVRLELWVKDSTLDQGQWLLAHVRVSNVGRRPVGFVGRFEDLDCPPLAFDADTSDLFDPGQTWTGVAAMYQERFLADGLLLRASLGIPARDRGDGCGDVGYAGRLAPGEVVEVPLAGLPAYQLRSQPLPPGVIHVSVAFSGRRRSDRVSVTTDVTLAGTPVAWPSPAQLVDAALATPGFVEALERVPDPRVWANAHVASWPRRPYPDQPRLAGAGSAPQGIVEVMQFTDGDLFVVGAVIDPWTGESFGSYWW